MLPKALHLLLILVLATTAAPQSSAPQTTQPPVAATPPVVNSDDLATALALLDRIDRVVADARNDKAMPKLEAVGTSGSRSAASGKVSIDASALDEIRAEIAQIKLLLQKEKQP